MPERSSLLTDIASRAGELVSYLPGKAPPPAEDELSSDLSLKDDIAAIFLPVLSPLGFELKKTEQKFLRDVTTYSSAEHKDGRKRPVLCIPPDLVRRPGNRTLRDFVALEHFFPDGASIYLLSEDVDVPHRNIRDIIDEIWPRRPGRVLRAKWLYWVDVRELAENPSLSERLDLIKKMLDLSNTAGQQALEVPRPPKMELQDRFALIKLLFELPDFSTGVGRTSMLGVAGLETLAQGLPEDAKSAAQTLVVRLLKAEERPHPMRLLLDYIVEFPPSQDAKTCAGRLITTYDFLR
jgi:hypothetical protein